MEYSVRLEDSNFPIPSFSLPDVLCDPTDLIWREGTPFEAMLGSTAFIDGLLVEIFRGFPHV
jgi:hypothetical protein